MLLGSGCFLYVFVFVFVFYVLFMLYVSWLMLFHLIYSLSFVPFTLFFSSIFFSPHLILYGVMRSGFASLNELPSAYFGVRHPWRRECDCRWRRWYHLNQILAMVVGVNSPAGIRLHDGPSIHPSIHFDLKFYNIIGRKLHIYFDFADIFFSWQVDSYIAIIELNNL